METPKEEFLTYNQGWLYYDSQSHNCLKVAHFFFGNYFIGKETYEIELFMRNKMKKQVGTMGTLIWIIKVQEDCIPKEKPQDHYKEKQDKNDVFCFWKWRQKNVIV